MRSTFFSRFRKSILLPLQQSLTIEMYNRFWLFIICFWLWRLNFNFLYFPESFSGSVLCSQGSWTVFIIYMHGGRGWAAWNWFPGKVKFKTWKHCSWGVKGRKKRKNTFHEPSGCLTDTSIRQYGVILKTYAKQCHSCMFIIIVSEDSLQGFSQWIISLAAHQAKCCLLFKSFSNVCMF